jgi:multicomponent Na+:H+ antiporter subunit D
VSALLGGIVLLPLVGALLCGVAPVRARPPLALATSLVVAGLVAGVTVEVWTSGAQRVAVAGWEPPLGIALVADGLSVAFLAMTAVVAVPLTVYASGSAKARGGTMFEALWLALWSSLNALYLSGDLFNVYVGLELMGVAAVALVALAGTASLAPALRYLVVAVLGSLAYLLGVALVYGEAGTLDMAQLGEQLEASTSTTVALSLMVLGLALKTALWPLHGWLPPAHSGAPSAVSPALSALVVKASFYLVVRLWSTAAPDVTTGAGAQLLGVLGAVAVLWGTVAALRQSRLKLVVAYSTVAQIGYLFLVFPLAFGGGGEGGVEAARNGWTGALVIALAHGLAKAAMFMSAGALALAHGSDRIRGLTGASARMPMATLTFGLAGISLAGLPPSIGFSGKWLALQSSLASGQEFYAAVLLVGGLLTAAYVGRVLRVVVADASPGGDALPALAPVPRRMEVTALLLALLAVLGGLAALPVVQLLEAGSPFGVAS